MIRSLLIANRGEIACRIIRTCRGLGIRSVAVFSDADADAQHVAEADASVRLGPPPARESYLRHDLVLDAARRTDCEAIHPGYGFLAESAAFVRAVRDAGFVFVGPPAEAMERLGDKDSAKRLMEAAGVPIVPGYHGEAQDDATLARAADGLGFPLMVKAVAGGGGKGMRRVERRADFGEALAACRREAAGAFGDDRVLLERVVERPRHVEVQIIADRHGGVVHLFERDCSVQRRHQKLVEEAPAPGLTDATRAAMHEAARSAARAAGYENAGTVEFLLAPDGTFFFIEMNTRLQVEHPVTEAITGIDLVEWQLRVAAGEPLPLAQERIGRSGHAIEVRLNAENPARGFLPSTGRIERFAMPFERAGIRIDTGFAAGDTISPHYDSLLAKVIVHAGDREAALDRLLTALAEVAVDGPATNLTLLQNLATAEPLRSAAVDTGWLEREGADLVEASSSAEPTDLLAAAAAVLGERDRTRPAGDPWMELVGWRLNAPRRRVVRLAAPAAVIEVLGHAHGDVARLGESTFAFRYGPGWVEIDGMRRRFVAHLADDGVRLTIGGRVLTMRVERPAAAAGSADAAPALAAPMPGKVTQVLVGTGDLVEAGQTLAVLEAMKMEHRFLAPAAGRVAKVSVAAGDQVEEGRILVEIEPLENSDGQGSAPAQPPRSRKGSAA